MELLSVRLRKPNGSNDVFGLRRLVASDEQKEEMVAALRLVHAIAWTDINLELRDAMPQIPVRTRISVNKPIHSHEDASATSEVLEAIDPVAEFVSLLDAHGRIVAHKLRTGEWTMMSSNVADNRAAGGRSG